MLNMRDQNHGVDPLLPEKFGKDFALELFRRGNYTHHFELTLKEVYEKGFMKLPIYLSFGTEFNSAALSMVMNSPDIFGQHRCHGTYLAFGGSPEALRDELLGLPTGCAGGRGGSNAIQGKEINMYGHSGLMGEQVPIATGSAFVSKKLTLCLFGDASAEEDYIYPSLGWAVSKGMPIIFVCEDNNLSILTEVKVRRNWSIVGVAKGLEMKAIEIADDPWTIAKETQSMIESGKPGLINIQSVRTHWHAGTGTDGEPEWNRYRLVVKKMQELGLEKEIYEIDEMNKSKVKQLWLQQLQKQ